MESACACPCFFFLRRGAPAPPGLRLGCWGAAPLGAAPVFFFLRCQAAPERNVFDVALWPRGADQVVDMIVFSAKKNATVLHSI